MPVLEREAQARLEIDDPAQVAGQDPRAAEGVPGLDHGGDRAGITAAHLDRLTSELDRLGVVAIEHSQVGVGVDRLDLLGARRQRLYEIQRPPGRGLGFGVPAHRHEDPGEVGGAIDLPRSIACAMPERRRPP